MKVSKINIKANKKLILFFNGWGMDDRAISHIPSNNFDVIMLNEYTDMQLDPSIIINYESIYIVAWSLGVWVANAWLQKNVITPTKTIAINGTLLPIHSDCGIAPDAFQGTIDHWNETNRTKFQMRMFKDRTIFTCNINKLPIRTIREQKEELTILQNLIFSSNIPYVIWNKVFIGSDDLIFGAENQLQFWQDNGNILQLSMPHYPFLELQTWDKITE